MRLVLIENSKNHNNRILVGSKTNFVIVENILFLEAQNNGTKITLKEHGIWVDLPLKKVAIKLSPKLFIQIARGKIINILHISWANSKQVKMNNGTELKIGRAFKPHIDQFFLSIVEN